MTETVRDSGARVPDAWQVVCPVDRLGPDSGVAALVHGQAVAIFRARDGEVHALGNHEPCARGPGLARGVVGVVDGVPVVTGPTHHHVFDLRTGACLDDETLRVACYRVRVSDGMVLVGPRTS